MAKKKLNSTIKRSRTRSGCVTCRDRHIKCDEQQPVCKNCQKSNRKCYRGIRLNFTQYTFYNPDDNKPKELQQNEQPNSSHYAFPNLEPNPVSQKHRILDQSITIASLYDDLKKYKPYIHLHTPEDLRESDLQFQEDTYNSYVSTSAINLRGKKLTQRDPGLSTSLSVINPTLESEIKPNPVILNQLSFHPPPNLNTGVLYPPTATAATTTTSSPTNHHLHPYFVSLIPNPQHHPMLDTSQHQETTSADPNQFDYSHLSMPQSTPLLMKYDITTYVRLIETEKYYMLLDLANELDIWKKIIPSLCLQISENDSFLLDCLMSCSRNTSVNLLDLTNEQLNKWSQLKNAPVISERIQQFEHILISIVLILLGLYLNTTKVRLTDYHKVIFNNQAKLFSHVLRKIHTFITSNKPNSAVLTNAIQSITMLKFFIDKNYDFSYEFKNIQKGRVTDTLEEITYSNSNLYSNPDISYISTFNEYEIIYLNNSYQNLVHVDQSNSMLMGESQLYKDLLWYLIKVDFVINYPEAANNLVLDHNVVYQQITNASTDLSFSNNLNYLNPRSYANYFLKEFIIKVLSMGSNAIIEDANNRINTLFNFIDQSYMDPELKSQFHHCFTWTVRYIHPVSD